MSNTKSKSTEEFLTVEDAARMLACSTSCVRRACQRKDLEHVRILAKGRYKIPRQAVERLLIPISKESQKSQKT